MEKIIQIDPLITETPITITITKQSKRSYLSYNNVDIASIAIPFEFSRFGSFPSVNSVVMQCFNTVNPIRNAPTEQTQSENQKGLNFNRKTQMGHRKQSLWKKGARETHVIVRSYIVAKRSWSSWWRQGRSCLRPIQGHWCSVWRRKREEERASWEWWKKKP